MVTYESLISRKDKIAVVGLGYVGLPLAVIFSKHFQLIGYDLSSERIGELKQGIDKTLEVSKSDLNAADIIFTNDSELLASARLIIVAVPTPIDEYRIPDLRPLRKASEIAGQHLTKGSCVVFESTVYPGATEELCAVILEDESGLKLGKDFTIGYSPERINPGDKEHTLENIKKIVSGYDSVTTALLYDVYSKIVKAGIHKASSIRVAEAAKVIENTQRDLNIALMNELAMIFDKMDIDTTEVLEAAGTKWNFLPFRPGLVGGHCIGVDPYYLTFKAESIGYNPEMILAGRKINNGMAKYIAERTIKMLICAEKQVKNAKIAILGITFKEDVPDLRNTKVIDIINELKEYGAQVVVHDPLADADAARKLYDIELSEFDSLAGADAVIVAVLHKEYLKMGLSQLAGLCGNASPVLIDIKSAFNYEEAAKHNITYWRL